MEITRKINGKDYTFTLTPQEISNAFYIEQNKYDKEDVRKRLIEMIAGYKDNDEIEICETKFKIKDVKEIIKDNVVLDSIASNARECMLCDEMISSIEWECIDCAIDDYFSKDVIN